MMKRILTLLTLFLVAVTTWAGERVVIFDPTTEGDVSTTPSPILREKDGVTMEISNGVSNGTQYRVYKGHTITICAMTGYITKIEFQCVGIDDAQYGPGCFVTNVGTYTYAEKFGVWYGRSECVTFTAEKSQVRLTKIIVTIEEDGICAPIITPVAGTYYEPFQVSMACYTHNARIHYTTDGSDPDSLSTQYTGPFTVDHSMTVKAVSVVDDVVSEVVSANYVIAEPPTVNCFEDLDPLADGDEVRFSSPIYALAQNNRYLFVKDGCDGYALIWGDVGQTYNNGDVIPAGFVVTKSFFNGEMELSNPQNFKPASDSINIEPEMITPGHVGHDMFGHYVILKKVTIIEENGTYYAVDSLGNRIPVYFRTLGISPPVDLTRLYDITGIIGSYGRDEVIYQLLPTKITPVPDDNKRIGLGNYWKFYDPVNPVPYEVTFDYDATVLLQSGSNLYLKDETGYGLVYGNVEQTYKHGDVIPAGYGGKVTYYDGWPELTKPFFGFQPPKDNVVVVPEVVTIPMIDDSFWGHFVEIQQVIIDKEKGVIRDENGNEFPIYIRPGLPFTYPEDLTQPIDIRGIVAAYRGKLQLIVWDLDDKDPVPVHCLQDTYNLPNPNVPFRIKLVAIYQYNANLYVQDLCGDYTLIYGNIGGPFVNGDTIEGVARLGNYQGHLQLIPEGDWVVVGHGPEVEPEKGICIEEVSQDMCHWYILFEDAKIVTEEDGKTYLEDECGSILLYNRFEIVIPEPGMPIMPPRDPYDLNDDGEVTIADVNCLIDMILSGNFSDAWTWSGDQGGEEMTWDVTGFLTVFNGMLEFYPIQFVPHGVKKLIIGDLNNDSEVNIADLNTLIDHIL